MLRLLHSLVVIIMLLPITVLAQVEEPGSGSNGCEIMPTLCSLDLLDGYTGFMGSEPPDSPPCPLTCANTVCNNNIWFSFIAANPTEVITIDPFDCGPAPGTTDQFGLQGEVFQVTDCNSPSGFTSVSNCFSQAYPNNDPEPFTLTVTGMVPNGVYTIMFDGINGSTCQFSISVAPSPSPPPPVLSAISGPTDLCPTSTPVQYCVDYLPAFNFLEYYTFNFTGSVTQFGTPYFFNSNQQVCIDAIITGPGPGTVTAVAEDPDPESCFDPTSSQLNINSELITTELPEETICVGPFPTTVELPFPFPNTTAYVPGNFFHPYTSYLGCDSIVSINIIPCLSEINQVPDIHVCESDLPYDFYGELVTGDPSTITTITANSTDSDCGDCTIQYLSLLHVYQNEAYIVAPDTLSCGPGALLTLYGDSSLIEEALGVSTFSWTASSGGNITSDPTLANIEVDEPGTYTLTLTTTSTLQDVDFSCSSTYSVEVVEDAGDRKHAGIL